jgi:4-alpha-glucanotransferase
MTDPVNVPGTSDEYPNWQRRMNCGLEDILAREGVRQLLAEVQAARA